MSTERKLVGTVVPPEAHEKIEDFAMQRGALISGIVRVALAEYLQKHGVAITLEELNVGKWGGNRREKEPA
jgi:hypothetical protein